MKAVDYGSQTNSSAAFVSTNSICQGRQVETLWSLIFAAKHEISFAYTSFKWANLASHNAGVSVIVVGISNHVKGPRKIFSTTEDLGTIIKEVDNINAYLVAGKSTIVAQRSFPLSEVSVMDFGSMANDGGGLLLTVQNQVVQLMIMVLIFVIFERLGELRSLFLELLELACG